MKRTHLSENKLATVTPLSNLVIVGTGASIMYDGTILDVEDTVAAATVDIIEEDFVDADDADDDAAATSRRRLASWSAMIQNTTKLCVCDCVAVASCWFYCCCR